MTQLFGLNEYFGRHFQSKKVYLFSSIASYACQRLLLQTSMLSLSNQNVFFDRKHSLEWCSTSTVNVLRSFGVRMLDQSHSLLTCIV